VPPALDDSVWAPTFNAHGFDGPSYATDNIYLNINEIRGRISLVFYFMNLPFMFLRFFFVPLLW
jgi:hypothetical protein